MTQKDLSNENEEQMKALEIENASYVEVDPVADKKSRPNPKSARQDQATTSKSAKTGALWFFTLLNFLLVVAAAVAGYWFWMQWQQSINTESTIISEHQQTLENQAGQLQTLNSNLVIQNTEIQQKFASVSSQAANASEQAEANRKNLADVSGRRPADWLLAEADYLVRMAGRKLWLENDVKTAVAMLQSADSRLQDLADPSLLPVRQFIASDIQTLQQINQVSLTSIALSLSGMIQQVNNLPLSLPEAQTDLSEPEEVEGMSRIWAYILSNFKYQPNSEPIKPLLTEQQQWLAKEQLRYALLQSQSAVMAQQTTLFQQSIQRAIGLLVQHYDLDSEQVKGFIAALTNLETTKIDKNYPQQLDAARPLQDMLESRMNNSFSNGQFEL